MNVDIYRSTISEMQPSNGDLVAMGIRDAVWLSCPLARSIQDWAMYADANQMDDIQAEHWENWGWALRGLLTWGVALVAVDVADAIISRVLDNEGF